MTRARPRRSDDRFEPRDELQDDDDDRPAKAGRGDERDSAKPDDLLELAAETRELVRRLEGNIRVNPERLSISAWNSAVATVLRNQAAMLESLARLAGLRREHSERVPVPADAASDSSDELDAVTDVLLGGEPESIRVPPAPKNEAAPQPRAPHDPAARVEGQAARTFVESFDNRDKSFGRGLEKLNQWVSGGGGTPFQYRGYRAYLNVGGLGSESVVRFEGLLMDRMGFDVRLGKLVIEGLAGEVVVYEKTDKSSRSDDGAGEV